ncbi:MAG: LemA family protein [Bacteroidetes bacterium]|nr:LemA family protein [Bacteroidota bacterium]
MKPVYIVVIGIVLVIGLAIFSGLGTYNGLVAADESVTQTWADVESQYQRRLDLIPNLVNTVQGAADFESETLQAVVEARAKATSVNVSSDDLGDPDKMASFLAAQESLSGALGRLLVVTENYPDLRATESFRDLTAQLEGTENRISVARRDYNASIASYNLAVRKFPASIVAGMTGFERKVPFEAQPGAEKAPTVSFE